MNVAMLDYALNNVGVVLVAAIAAAYLAARFRRSRRKTVRVRVVV